MKDINISSPLIKYILLIFQYLYDYRIKNKTKTKTEKEQKQKDEITEEQSNFFSLTYKKSHMSLHLKHFYAYREIANRY